MGLSSLVRDVVGGGKKLTLAADANDSKSEPTRKQIMQSRYNHGPNIGAWFVNEKWICDGLHCEESGGSELDAVTGFVKKSGESKARDKWNEHYKTWINDQDWQWMKDKGVTAVRVPIGYWIVDNGRFCDDTPFEKYSKVYKDAWTLFKELCIEKANVHDIGVLVDFHGLPGGANDQEHSGTSSGKADLWKHRKNRALALKVLEFIAADLSRYDNVAGIQVLNEAPYCDDSNSSSQESFYCDASQAIRKADPEVPIAISDGWNLPKISKFVAGSIKHRKHPGVIIDTHVYRCFSQEDCHKSASELIQNIGNAIQKDFDDDIDVMVGEFSCVLAEDSWKNQDRGKLVTEYGQKQMSHFYDKARAGAYFWTYRFEHGSGGEWGFREMTDKGALSSFKHEPVTKQKDEWNKLYEDSRERIVGSHKGYWSGQDSHKDWQFDRFEKGFEVGWRDAQTFHNFNHSELGRLGAWRLAREAQHVAKYGDSEMEWQFKHGFDQALQAFQDAVR